MRAARRFLHRLRHRLRHRLGSARHEESGNAVIEGFWLALLLMVPLLWIVMSVFDVQRGALGTTAAARAAGRAFALADTDAEGRARASDAARRVLADQGVTGVPVDVDVTCTSPGSSCHSGGAVITVTVRTKVTLPLLPDLLGGGKPSFALDATHTVPIGQYQEIR